MKTYRIIGRTNGWIAQRDVMFGGKTYIVIEKGLTLKEAQKKILDFFNEDYETYYKNWGLVRCNSDFAYSNSDGTRGYEYDSRYFEIEEFDPQVFRSEDNNGNTLYIGSSLKHAIDSILESEELYDCKLFGDEEVMWDGMFETESELKALL